MPAPERDWSFYLSRRLSLVDELKGERASAFPGFLGSWPPVTIGDAQGKVAGLSLMYSCLHKEEVAMGPKL